MKVYKYDLWFTLGISIICVLVGVNVVKSEDFMSILWIVGNILILWSIYIMISMMIFPPKISVDTKLHIKGVSMFSKEIPWEDILSIKTVIFLRMLTLIIEFSKEGKRKRIRISPLIIGYRELTKKIVEKANNANIDYKTKAFLQSDLGHPEIFSLWLARIHCFITIIIAILCLFV